MSNNHLKSEASPVLEGEQSLTIYEATGSTSGSDFYDLIDKKRVSEVSRPFDAHSPCNMVGCERPAEKDTGWCTDHVDANED